jgi:hypothetical protein
MDTQILMQKVAEVAPDKFDFIVKTADEVRESPFRDEIVEQLDTIVKRAAAMAPQSMLSRFGGAAAGVGAMAATGIAYSLAGDMYDAVKRGVSKSRNYRSMMKENPDLKDLPAVNVQKAFATLHRFNPEFAGDPTVAGSFVRRQAQFPEFDTNQLANLVGARKNLSDLKKLPVPGKLPWETSGEKALRGSSMHHLQAQGDKARKEIEQSEQLHPFRLTKAKQDADPELQAQMRSDPQQQALWEAQERLARTQRQAVTQQIRAGGKKPKP